MRFTNFDMRMFNEARKEAEKSTFDRSRVGCVIAYKGHIISRGRNDSKSHPLQKFYNRRYRRFNVTDGQMIVDSIHAETHAISNINYVVGKDVDWSKVKVYVCRVRKDGTIACSRPCCACENMLRSLGIVGCYYTEDNNSLAYTEYL